jgi:hypothetical protein
MVLITIVLVIIGGLNQYAYYSYFGLTFLIKEITMPMLIFSTFKCLFFMVACFVFSYLAYKVGVLFARFINLFFSDLKNKRPLIWILIANCPSLSILYFPIYFDLKDYSFISVLISFTIISLVLRNMNNKFSSEDFILIFYIVFSFFIFGVIEAKRDLNSATGRLPKMEIEKRGKEDWRLFYNFGEKIIAINLRSQNKTLQYKILSIDNVKFTFTSN